MNLQFTSFPFVEKLLVWGGIYLSCVFIIILSSFLNKEKTAKKAGGIFYLIIIIFLFFLNILLFLYLKSPVESVAGIEIKQNYIFLLNIFFIYILFSFNKSETGYDYIVLIISIICIQLLFFNSSIIQVFLLFVVFETASSFLIKEINVRKYFYILIAMVFLSVFFTQDKIKAQTIGINGILTFMLLSNFATTRTLNISEILGDIDRNNNLYLLNLLVSFIVFFKLVEFYNSYSPVIYVLFLVSFILLFFSVFNFLTEEDLFNFFVLDFINVFYLTIFSFSIINVNNMDIIIIFILMLTSAVALTQFFPVIQKKYSISFIRYNFNRIKGAGFSLLCIILTLLTEVYLIYRVVNNFIYFNPYIQTIILITGFVYGVSLLNKIFIIFSMTSRIKTENLKDILFNKIIIRPVLFILFIISLIYRGIKNG